MLVKTDELIGPALDWAVGIAEGNPMERPASDVVWSKYHGAYNPSTDWSQGGPLIEKYEVSVVSDNLQWSAHAMLRQWIDRRGDTPLIAACRAIVAAKLGNQVEIPDELMQS